LNGPVTLVDTNVLFDYLTEDSEWFDWSSAMLEEASNTGTVAINQVVYAEVSIRYSTLEQLDDDLSVDYFARLSIPWEAAFLAGKVFARYKRQGGTRRSPLPDFFIGAHAAVTGMTLLTRDARRYRAYFPKLKIIAPA
jgi:predicted nucleic acid-binding protein